jgi:hypothetical protein
MIKIYLYIYLKFSKNSRFFCLLVYMYRQLILHTLSHSKVGGSHESQFTRVHSMAST